MKIIVEPLRINDILQALLYNDQKLKRQLHIIVLQWFYVILMIKCKLVSSELPDVFHDWNEYD